MSKAKDERKSGQKSKVVPTTCSSRVGGTEQGSGDTQKTGSERESGDPLNTGSEHSSGDPRKTGSEQESDHPPKTETKQGSGDPLNTGTEQGSSSPQNTVSESVGHRSGWKDGGRGSVLEKAWRFLKDHKYLMTYVTIGTLSW